MVNQWVCNLSTWWRYASGGAFVYDIRGLRDRYIHYRRWCSDLWFQVSGYISKTREKFNDVAGHNSRGRAGNRGANAITSWNKVVQHTVNVTGIAFTYFLVVTAYATHQHRLFDIQFYIPWSKVRARKTAFCNRVRAMIAEIADLGSVREATHRLSETLGCSVAWSAPANRFSPWPAARNRWWRSRWSSCTTSTASWLPTKSPTLPETLRSCANDGVAAVVPFYWDSQSASGWMLLGDAFQRAGRHATRLQDGRVTVRQDGGAVPRQAATDARSQLAAAGPVANDGVPACRGRNRHRDAAERKRNPPAIESAPRPRAGCRQPVGDRYVEGRDAAQYCLARSRQAAAQAAAPGFFLQADQYAGPDSSSFRRQNLPDVLICRMDAAKASAGAMAIAHRPASWPDGAAAPW